MKTTLVLDVHYLCHRAWHTTRLEYKGNPTGVIFGFLMQIGLLKDQFATDHVAFCFESKHSIRADLYPDYKRKRHTKTFTDEELIAYRSLKIQINQLYESYLPRIGFKNVFSIHGYESDDIMAKLALDCPNNEEVVLVTADSDLYQCLRDGVTIYSPQKQKIYTHEWFWTKYGILPTKWAMVKAISGCACDEVKGIPGIGELTALRFCRGHLNDYKRYQKITSEAGKEIVRRNRRLVELPLEGCPGFQLQKDEINPDAWKAVCEELGMKRLAGRPPVAVRKSMPRIL